MMFCVIIPNYRPVPPSTTQSNANGNVNDNAMALLNVIVIDFVIVFYVGRTAPPNTRIGTADVY